MEHANLDLGELILDLLGNVPINFEETSPSSFQSTRWTTRTRPRTAYGETRPTRAENGDSGATRR